LFRVHLFFYRGCATADVLTRHRCEIDYKHPAVTKTIPLLLALCLCSCAGDQNFRVLNSTQEVSGPTQLQLSRNRSVGTLHFPAGVYNLYAADDSGWYYRAPKKVVQHSWGGSVQYDGGVFVEKRRPDRARGYIVWEAGLTKVGTVPKMTPVAAAIPAEGPPPAAEMPEEF
jgi:hypothetical protein